jgi:type I restriction enzyme R subunit
VDFIGILKDLNKALAFDPDNVNGVIDDLDVLFARFTELMQGPGQSYLVAAGMRGGNDELLDTLLYDTFLDKEKRQAFTEFFIEVETLYEILSPDPQLRDYIDDYNHLADLYVMLRNAYGKKTTFLGDIAHKTEMLVRENAAAHGLDKLSKSVEFDETALKALKDEKGTENGKVINLVKSLATSAGERGEKEPYLISIGERAESIMTALEERQISTGEAMAKIENLMEEKLKAEKARKESGLDPDTFEIFWFLQHEKIPTATMLAKEINAVYSRFPNFASNSDEQRQLKAEIYKSLLREVSGRRMVEIGEGLLRLKGIR